jgi:beta-RFAP synthase
VTKAPAPIAAGITVSVPARLHLGFLDFNGDLGRRFGSVGIAIGGLRTTITLAKAERAQVDGPNSARAERYLDIMQRHLGLPGFHRLTVDEAVPAHAGLGSGTQLALAIATAVRRLHDIPIDVRGDAVRLGRGARSGVGIGLFNQGGLVVDGGRGASTQAAPIVARLAVPESWRVLLVLDPKRTGVHGPEEENVFVTLPPFSAEQAAHLCRLVLMQALPSLAEHDIVNFGSAIKQMQARLGDYFAPAQGGHRFTSPTVTAALNLLDRAGAFGIGQSSWGPTGFAFAPSAQEASRLLTPVRAHPDCQGLDFRICTALNRGAEISVHAAENAHTA